MQDTKNYESNTSNRASAIIIVPYQVAVMPLDLTKTQLFVVQSDFADVVSVGVVHLLIVLKLVVIGDWNSSWAVFRFMDSSSFNR